MQHTHQGLPPVSAVCVGGVVAFNLSCKTARLNSGDSLLPVLPRRFPKPNFMLSGVAFGYGVEGGGRSTVPIVRTTECAKEKRWERTAVTEDRWTDERRDWNKYSRTDGQAEMTERPQIPEPPGGFERNIFLKYLQKNYSVHRARQLEQTTL